MRVGATICALICILCGPAWSNAPEISLRPDPRPGVAEAQAGPAIPALDPAPTPSAGAPASEIVVLPLDAMETGPAPAADDVPTDPDPGAEPPAPTQVRVEVADADTARPTERPEELAARPIPVVTRVAITASVLAPRSSLRPGRRPGVPPAPEVAAAPPSDPPPVATPAPPPQIERRGLFGGIFRPQGQTRVVRSGGANSQLAVARSLRPGVRPAGLEQRVRAAATRATPGRVTQPGRRGALCGVPGLVGDRLESITGRISGCGIREPVRLREVNGVALSSPATINCDTARALQTWLTNSAQPAVGRRGGGITSLRVVASYACRTRNSRRGARLSEHATGNAIDIAGIGLANGSEITVLNGWRDRRVGPILQEMHRGACGPFGTVLGPNSDRFHQDHFHFDVASYRSGPYCR
jgi:hypothetical protein